MTVPFLCPCCGSRGEIANGATTIRSPDSSDAVLREALQWIVDQQYNNRSTVSPENAWDAFKSLNKQICEIYNRARAALSSTPSQRKNWMLRGGPWLNYPCNDPNVTECALSECQDAMCCQRAAPSPNAVTMAHTEREALAIAIFAQRCPGVRMDEADIPLYEAAAKAVEDILDSAPSPAAGSDGWQRDAALEEAAALCEHEAAENENSRSNVIERSFFEIKAEEGRQLAKSIRALKSAAPTQTDGWRPIETAPKYRIIWLWHRAYAGGPCLGYWNDLAIGNQRWWSACDGAGSCLLTPSHWYPAFPPLPAAPTPSTASGGE